MAPATGPIGFLGLGEAGSAIARDLVAAGASVRGWDPLVPRVDTVATTACAADVATGAHVVISLNSAADAVDAARSVAAGLGSGQVYADGNTAAPARKREVAAVIAPTGAQFVDVALMQSVPGRGLKVPVLASGPGAACFVQALSAYGMPVEDGGPEVGVAAARKLARSVFVKGMAAAIGESLAAGEALGCAEWLRAEIERTVTGADAAMVGHLVEGSRRHAVRRRAEMAAAQDMLDELGVAPHVAAAARAWLGDLAVAGGRMEP
jgi:3-hydroxyisobutyrate dehydrogenase-like beta-hydroxyacid dehydrogenase